jgi:hypothetical protein
VAFPHLSSRQEIQASEVSADQYALLSSQHSASKSNVVLLERELAAQKLATSSLQHDKESHEEKFRKLYEHDATVSMQLDGITKELEDSLSRLDESNLEKNRSSVLSQKLEINTILVDELKSEVDILRKDAYEAENATSILQKRCMDAEKNVAASHVLIQKLERIGVDEMQEVKNNNIELIQKLSESREQVLCIEKEKQVTKNANASLLFKLKVKAEKEKDLVQRCETVTKSSRFSNYPPPPPPHNFFLHSLTSLSFLNLTPLSTS